MTTERRLHAWVDVFEPSELCSHSWEFGLILARCIPLWTTAKGGKRLEVCPPTSHHDDCISAERKPGSADPRRINAGPEAGIR